ncbi:MAG: hypothetical protein AAGU76_15340 [Sedimentibacter sp.]|uniref:hypothetical protein n=1 Tax=Sedimentibacter sp. TaxID=1960295 RepID=UPI003159114C
MKYEIQKVTRIADVIIDFYLSHSAKKLDMSIEDLPDKYIMTFEAAEIKCSNKTANDLNKLLSSERQKEVEEVYWQLGSNDVQGEEINLIGMMVDEVKIEYNCPSLKIKMVRKK